MKDSLMCFLIGLAKPQSKRRVSLSFVTFELDGFRNGTIVGGFLCFLLCSNHVTVDELHFAALVDIVFSYCSIFYHRIGSKCCTMVTDFAETKHDSIVRYRLSLSVALSP